MKQYSRKRIPSLGKTRIKPKKKVPERDNWQVYNLAKRLEPKKMKKK